MSNNYILSAEALISIQGSSKGAQPKYYDKGYWYKINNIGYEGLAEELVSVVEMYSNIRDYVAYEKCSINGKSGCRSRDFCRAGDMFISFQKLYETYTGADLMGKMRMIDDVPERISFVVSFVKETTGVDCSDYLSKVLTLDMLTLNTDRHFNNMGVVANAQTGIYRPAPVFDNGNSLLSDVNQFDEETLQENIEKVYGKPFSSNLEMQAYHAGYGLKLDYSRLERMLDSYQQCQAVEVLRMQLERYRGIIPEFSITQELETDNTRTMEPRLHCEIAEDIER